MTGLYSVDTSDSRRALVLDALGALVAADVDHALRNGSITVDDPASDVDILVRSSELDKVDRALRAAGWSLLAARGHQGHRFYLREAADLTWVKLDVVWLLRYGKESASSDAVLDRRRCVDGLWLVSEADASAHAQHRAAGRREVPTRVERVLRGVPNPFRERGCVVAILGPDGAGKGTVTASLAASLPLAVTLVYLGNRRARTEADPGVPTGGRPGRRGHGTTLQRLTAAGLGRTLWEVSFLFRKGVSWIPPLLRAQVAVWRGHVVLADRHPLDALAVHTPRTRLGRVIEQRLATGLAPEPDAIVVLDAPGQIFYDRKGEHTPELLEQWRQGYRTQLVPRGAVLVDASGPVAATTAHARHVVWQALAGRRGWERS